ncbi:heterokaryon incompatibility protein-domain-containing protein, partial [Lineolata rhizophorae]
MSRNARKRQRDWERPPPYVHEPLGDKPTFYDEDQLVVGRGWIRLLVLLPGPSDDVHVTCELKKVSIDQNGRIKSKYEALSWHWRNLLQSSQRPYINIRQDEGIYSKEVQPDILAALMELRQPHRNRYLWIDFICIDQDNFPEKNHQVEMMSTIYGQAEQVCVWLGAGDRSSNRALKFIKEEVLQLQNFDELCESKEAIKKWSALLDLMQRPWFSRRWVVQEIALARSATIYCGSESISWEHFAVAVELFVEVETATHRLSEVMKTDPDYYHIPGWFEYVSFLGASLLVEATSKLFRNYKPSDPRNLPAVTSAEHSVMQQQEEDPSYLDKSRQQPLLSLEYLVSSLAIFEATVSHDTIYCLLAIAQDTTPIADNTEFAEPKTENAVEPQDTARGASRFTHRRPYRVSYGKPYVDVCQEFIQFCIQQSEPSRALDIICRPWAQEDNHNLRQRFPSSKVPRDEGVPMPSWIPQLSGAAHIMHSQPGHRTLKMGRKNADILVGLPSTLQRNYNAAGTRTVDRKVLRFCKRVGKGIVDDPTAFPRKHYSMYIRGFILDKVTEIYPASQGGAIPQDWADAAGWTNIDPADENGPPDEFWRTLVADRGRDGRNPPVYYARACKESFLKGGLESGSVDTTKLIDNERCSIIAQFCRRVQAVIWNRCLIKTGKGSLGLASKVIEKGDLVCILYGCSVPVILRKNGGKKEDEVRDEWKEDTIKKVEFVQKRWRSYAKKMERLEKKWASQSPEIQKTKR